jgi:hypothetical protein
LFRNEGRVQLPDQMISLSSSNFVLYICITTCSRFRLIPVPGRWSLVVGQQSFSWFNYLYKNKYHGQFFTFFNIDDQRFAALFLLPYGAK